MNPDYGDQELHKTKVAWFDVLSKAGFRAVGRQYESDTKENSLALFRPIDYIKAKRRWPTLSEVKQSGERLIVMTKEEKPSFESFFSFRRNSDEFVMRNMHGSNMVSWRRFNLDLLHERLCFLYDYVLENESDIEDNRALIEEFSALGKMNIMFLRAKDIKRTQSNRLIAKLYMSQVKQLRK